MASQPDSEPQAGRPQMPGYGIADANSGSGLLPWNWAVERLQKARNYWISTTRPDGRPHAMPVWGVWYDNQFYFSTGRESRKARNLAVNGVRLKVGLRFAHLLDTLRRSVTGATESNHVSPLD